MVAIPLRGFLFATHQYIGNRYWLVDIVAIPLRGFLFATNLVGVVCRLAVRGCCNPLTGLFVCNMEVKRIKELQGKLQSPYGAFCLQREIGVDGAGWPLELLQSPYGAFCLQPAGQGPADIRPTRSCNPLTGLFVCNEPSETARGLVQNVGCNPLTELFVCNCSFV